uniref:histone deacetylase n=1 Tax=viral metagenome TaxID=1070528 RepID=A0A6C0BE44_9ZZZZ
MKIKTKNLQKMVLVYFTSSEEHNKEEHFENKLRVVLPEKYLRNKLPKNLFINALDISDDDFIQIVSNAHGRDILNDFNVPDDVICKNYINDKTCYTEYSLRTNSICPECSSKDYYWYLDKDTYCTVNIKKCLLDLVSNLKAAIDNITSEQKNHYLLVRPPGHHCYNKSSGFCPINNVFTMATYAKTKGFQRIFILDWDFHHGNGTENLVNGKNGIFFVSIHGYGVDGYRVYPGTGSKYNNSENTKNIALFLNNHEERLTYTDTYYMSIIETDIDEWIKNFNPDLILISNGLDAHRDDALEGMNLTDNFYVRATKHLKSYNVPLVYVLEGGYTPEVIQNVSYKVIEELMK